MTAFRQRVPKAPFVNILFYRFVAFVFTLLIVACIVALAGQSPFELVTVIVRSTFLSRLGWEDWFLYASPLFLTSAAFAVGAKLNIWNIGMEGQFMAGALASAIVGLYFPYDSFWVLVAMLGAGCVGGVLWMAIPAFARVFGGTNEIITTLLLNFVAALLVSYVVTGPLRDTVTSALASSEYILPSLPLVWGDVHMGVIIAFVIVGVLALYMHFTRQGYEMRVIGANPRLAFYAGLPVKKLTLVMMLLSGGLAGLAGMFEVAGSVHRLQVGLSNNFGYLGIIVAILARGSFLGLIPASLFIAFLLNAGIILQTMQLSSTLVMAMTGLLLLFITIADELAHYITLKPEAEAKTPKIANDIQEETI
ncbi:ABC transporter permease [Entomobacter blattae]|uniref:Branched-chain amino acid transport system / permease component n=1 Tax=Entomobacter blattae TaxID=2762277 RepID=A0A7H1NU82_9PROT|nr:ABC transporter permease [Entomobacter blattae]QNT79342.1 Branched-chain amino acid transport system / permease component [Entomobacter blattae]